MGETCLNLGSSRGSMIRRCMYELDSTLGNQWRSTSDDTGTLWGGCSISDGLFSRLQLERRAILSLSPTQLITDLRITEAWVLHDSVWRSGEPVELGVNLCRGVHFRMINLDRLATSSLPEHALSSVAGVRFREAVNARAWTFSRALTATTGICCEGVSDVRMLFGVTGHGYHSVYAA